MHAAFEELHVYPAYQQATQDTQLVPRNFEMHALMEDCLKKFRPDMTDAQLDLLIQTLQQVVRAHVQDEETVMFPRAREVMGAEVLDALAEQLQQSRPNLTKQVSFTVSVLAEAAIKTTQEAGR